MIPTPRFTSIFYNVDTGELSDGYDVDVNMLTAPDLPDGLKIIDTDVVFKVTSR